MSDATRVTFITQWFAPEPTIVPDQIARGLKAAGISVRVLTGVPNYPTGVVVPGYRASRWRDDVVHGLPVRRTPLYPSHDSSALRRIANYLSWAASSSVFGLGAVIRSDVNVVYGSPITAALPALVARATKRVPFVLIVQDVWPDSVFSTGFLNGRIGIFANAALTRFCNLVYRSSARVVVISEGMRSLLASRGVPEDKIDVIYNWSPRVESEWLSPESLRERCEIPDNERLVLYAGNHGQAQALGFVIDGLAACPDDLPLHLVMVGDGVEKAALQRQAAELGLRRRIHFIDRQPAQVVRGWAQEADAQLVSLADDPLFDVTLPSKLQACLSSGSAVLMVGRGDPAKVVQNAGCGEVARPHDATSVCEAFVRLASRSRESLRALGSRGRDYYESNMSADVGEKKYADLVRSVIEPNGNNE